jgi:hypothetical protein
MDPMSQPPQLSAAGLQAYKDRKTGLVIFGVLELLLGAFCVLALPLMILGQVLAARAGDGTAQFRIIAPAIAVYAVMGALFITLGVGSIRARRWARTFSLILGWSGLILGVIGLVAYTFILPRMLNTQMPNGQVLPPGARVFVMLIALTLMSVIFVVLPGALVLFYQSRHVKATCEARDPVVRWTDGRPLPVLGLSVWLFFGGICLVLMPVAYRGVAPFFGELLSGMWGGLFYVALAVVFLYLARETYRLKPMSWWITLALVLVFGVSNVVTFARVDLIEMYKLMGYPESQLRLMEQLNVFQGSALAWWSALAIVPLLVYLLFVKRFFPPKPGLP